jgi:LuxR family maltose regulon positive regulatory protein
MDKELDQSTILTTKLHRPPLPADHVSRTKVLKHLDKFRQCPLTLVSAPAGYGKSILVSSWLIERKIPTAWISLDEDDNHLQIFLEYVIASLQKIFPENLKKTTKLVKSVELPPLNIITSILLNDLDEIDEEFVLVLDDYHLIVEKKIHDLLDQILRFPPENMSLCIVTRRDPPLNINSLRAYNRLSEVRMNDLVFDRNEIEMLIKKILGFPVSENTSESLLEKTEGWVAGLILTALSVSTIEELENRLKKVGGNFQLVTEYLIEEVLSKQPEDFQNYLIKTSLLDRFCSEITEELYQPEPENGYKKTSGSEFIAWLTTTNLFIIPLDDEQKWFRYHHEFQRLLQIQLKKRRTETEIKEIHKRASRWFETHGLIEEAIQHALKADDIQSAVNMVLENRYRLMNSEQWQRLIIWMGMLPPDCFENNPLLLTTKALCHDYCGQMADCFALIPKVESLLSKIDAKSPEFNTISAEFYTLKSQYSITTSDGKSAKIYSIKALEHLPHDAQYIKTFAMYWYAFSYQMTNNAKEGIRKINEALSNPTEFEPHTHTRLYVALAGIYLMEGDLEMLMKTAQATLELGEKYHFQETIDLAYYFLSSKYYYTNEFEQARKYHKLIYENRYATRSFYVTLCLLNQSMIEASEGYGDAAWKTMDTITDFAEETDDTASKETIPAFRIELALYQGNLKLVEELYHDINFEFPPLWLCYHRQLTEVKAMLAINEIDKAEEKITMLIAYGRSIHNMNFLIHALPLEALLYWKKDEEKAAFKSISESLGFSEGGGYIRPYTDLGNSMKDLLNRYMEVNGQNSYVEKIIKSFLHESNVKTISDPFIIKELSATPKISLTPREIEILKYIADGLRNKEIADKLFLAPETVKKHLYNIYQKFDIHSRMNVVVKARELGMIG